MDTPRRSKTALPPSSTQQRSRQDPVSCESCRKKKLKCSRQHPCTNCTSRGIVCEFNRVPVGASAWVISPVAEGGDFAALREENVAVKARLERLEAIVYSRCSDEGRTTEGRPAKVRRIEDGGVGLTQGPTPPASIAPPAEAARNYIGDYRWLECIGAQENGRLSKLSLPLTTRIESLENIIQFAITETNAERVILIPPYEDSASLADAYIEHLDPAQHIIHIPTVKRNLRVLYDQLERGDAVEPNQTVLALAMLAAMASYWGLGQCSNAFFPRQHMAIKVGQLWLRTTLDILEYVRRSAAANLETLQASMIAMIFLFHMEGSSPKVRAMLLTALSTAKDLHLHRIDDPSLPPIHPSEVDKETRRRVWWFLVLTDWGMACSGGPHEGSYNISPKHMRVKLPRNITDEELTTMPPDFDHPPDHPTIMAFGLHRIKLGNICCEMADLRWLTYTDEVPVEDIQSLDTKFDAFFDDLPPFLRLDKSNKLCYAHLDLPGSYIRLQRYILNLGGHAKRCKFHLPFLLRASFDSNYRFCREACLRSARMVIQIREEIMLEGSTLWIANPRLCSVLHLLFYATVVLVMDLCVNRGEECETTRMEEIRRACKPLEDAKRQSAAVGMFLDSLMTILRKHRIRLEGKELSSTSTTTNIAAVDTNTLADVNECPATTIQGCPHHPYNAETTGLEETNDLDLGDVWQSYVGMEFAWDPQSWDALISDIERVPPREDDFLSMHIAGF